MNPANQTSHFSECLNKFSSTRSRREFVAVNNGEESKLIFHFFIIFIFYLIIISLLYLPLLSTEENSFLLKRTESATSWNLCSEMGVDESLSYQKCLKTTLTPISRSSYSYNLLFFFYLHPRPPFFLSSIIS